MNLLNVIYFEGSDVFFFFLKFKYDVKFDVVFK